jgi:hypothetical protein
VSNQPAAEISTNRYGPLSFVIALMNILLLNSALWTLFIYSYWGYEFLFPLLVVDLVLSVLLNFFSGRLGRAGRGMLIGWISVPVSLFIFGTGLAIANAIRL